VAGLALYWALIGGGFATWQGDLSASSLVVTAAIPAGVLLVREPLQRLADGDRPRWSGGVGTGLVESVFELLETLISVVSNTLSFVRLGAFAVAHAGLMHVVFRLAEGSAPPVAAIVVLIGTIVVVGLEGLVVSIQALRLQFYEFFGKFFRGDGQPFQPLRLFAGREP
jgi:V/A-type H+-transporting ATPase subunit I